MRGLSTNPQDRGIETLTGHTSFVSDDDSLVLEDESARMALKGNAIAAGPLVTGVVAAVRGVSSANGDFQVKVRNLHAISTSVSTLYCVKDSSPVAEDSDMLFIVLHVALLPSCHHAVTPLLQFNQVSCFSALRAHQHRLTTQGNMPGCRMSCTRACSRSSRSLRHQRTSMWRWSAGSAWAMRAARLPAWRCW